MMPGPLQVDAFVFDSHSKDNSSGPGLKMTAKRYTTARSAQNVGGLTLLFAHCVGAHKEQWEPTIQRLFHAQQCKAGAHRIREVWSLDRPNHGDAAVLNREALNGPLKGVSGSDWASAIASFTRSPRMKNHRLVAIGHSAGAATVMLTAKELLTYHLPFLALILVEPTMISSEVFYANKEQRMAALNMVIGATSARRDTWDSRQAAFDWFTKRPPWKLWDPRVTRLFSEYGLQETATGVTLKCSKEHEASAYIDLESHFDATAFFGHVCRVLPVHIIWGDSDKLVPRYARDSLTDSSEGRVAASMSTIHNAGHLIVQEQPDRLADVIREILDTVHTDQVPLSKL